MDDTEWFSISRAIRVLSRHRHQRAVSVGGRGPIATLAAANNGVITEDRTA
ncbi:MAG TPA: hypothetical protein VFW65_18105 [Pseudonocardiaceae bacterium]|nr:hypothetical protein [Pseudonocardiaceae bacterium]